MSHIFEKTYSENKNKMKHQVSSTKKINKTPTAQEKIIELSDYCNEPYITPDNSIIDMQKRGLRNLNHITDNLDEDAFIVAAKSDWHL